MSERLVVIGGDPGGMAAATEARRRRPELDIVALEKGAWTSYSACGLPYLVAGDVVGASDLIVRSPQQFREQHAIDVRTRSEVMAIDLDRRRVEVRDHEHDRTYELPFDLLHLGLGALPLRPPLPGIDLDMIHGIQTLGDGIELVEHAASIGAQRVVVVGGGYIGVEMAEAFVQRGAQSVTVVEAGPQVMGTLDSALGELVGEEMGRHGIDVRCSTAVEGFEPGAVLTSNGRIATDLVVLGLGVTPNTALAGEAGIDLGVKDAIKVDHRQATSAAGVSAAGDCCESYHLVARRPVHIALGTVANKQARVAGINLGGGHASFPGVVGTAIARLCALEVARTGLSEREALAWGFDHVTATIEASTKAGYFPGTEPMTVKLVAEAGSGRLLGGQIVGGQGAAKRIDTLATALFAGLNVTDLIDLDLAYAPPFSSVWDPLQVAARQLAR
ncbi:MAG TPA: FAD-dependent oxidoreductase [Acidimicrobiales bacterium]|nr:FAD-dependent oxidoreductase [Acidimicrobiales bacterium]